MIQHLTQLIFSDLPEHPVWPDAAGHLDRLSTCLSHLPSLRNLQLNGCGMEVWEPDNMWQGAEQAAVSDRLAHAVGSLTRLTCLELDGLGLYLSVRDCYAHLHGLARLRRLRLVVEVDSAGLAVHVGDLDADVLARQAFVRLLPSFNQLVDLSLDQVPRSVSHDAHLLCEVICALPQLRRLSIRALLDDAAYATLAVRIRHGLLLEKVEQSGTVERWNAIAGRQVFSDSVS